MVNARAGRGCCIGLLLSLPLLAGLALALGRASCPGYFGHPRGSQRCRVMRARRHKR